MCNEGQDLGKNGKEEGSRRSYFWSRSLMKTLSIKIQSWKITAFMVPVLNVLQIARHSPNSCVTRLDNLRLSKVLDVSMKGCQTESKINSEPVGKAEVAGPARKDHNKVEKYWSA